MGRLPSFNPSITDEISADDSSSTSPISLSFSRKDSSLIVSNLRVLGKNFVMVSEKVICFAMGVDVLLLP